MKELSLGSPNIEVICAHKENHFQETIQASLEKRKVAILSNITEQNTLLFFSGKQPIQAQRRKEIQMKKKAKTISIEYLHQKNQIEASPP